MASFFYYAKVTRGEGKEEEEGVVFGLAVERKGFLFPLHCLALPLPLPPTPTPTTGARRLVGLVHAALWSTDFVEGVVDKQSHFRD